MASVLGVPVPVDELALEFEDGHLLLPQWVEVGWLPRQAVPAFAAVDRALAEMSGGVHSELWTVAALHDAPEWAQVRHLAAQVLHLL